MPIFSYICNLCGKEFKRFSTESLVCDCGSVDVKKRYVARSHTKSVERTDRYHGVDAPAGIEEDLKMRSKRDSYEQLDDLIDEHGLKNAREMGWVDERGKKVEKDIFLHRKNRV